MRTFSFPGAGRIDRGSRGLARGRMVVPHALLSLVATLVVDISAADDPSTVVLANGVVMPRVLLGMGPWCNDPVRCPAPAKPCHDCYNDTSAAADIKLALANGFAGIDTALGYVSPRLGPLFHLAPLDTETQTESESTLPLPLPRYPAGEPERGWRRSTCRVAAL